MLDGKVVKKDNLIQPYTTSLCSHRIVQRISQWGPSFTTGPAPAHWPGLLTLDSSHFVALYTQSGGGALSRVYSPE
jgi:hypothetical protein